MGFVDIKEFDFIDKPPVNSLDSAIRDLELYQAIEGKDGPITEIGREVGLIFVLFFVMNQLTFHANVNII